MRSRSVHAIIASAAVLLLTGCAYESLTGALTRGPDLAVSDVDVRRGAPGVYTFSATIVNQGTNRALANHVQLSIDVGSDDQWEIVTTAQRIGQLTRGNSVTVQWSNAGTENVFTWTAAAGTHRARVCADVESGGKPSAVQESNETNNCTVEKFTVR